MSSKLSKNCYVGAFGTCDECDQLGSCICDAFWSTKNHYLALDRTDWGEIRLVCSTLDPAIKGLDVIALLCQLILVIFVLKAFRNQQDVIRSSRLKWWQHLPIWVLSFVLLHLCFAIGFALQDLLRYDWLIGIHAIPSLLFFFRVIFLYMAEASNSLNTLKVSMSVYEFSRGVDYIRAVARHEQLVILAQAIFFILSGFVPLLGVALASSGYTEMSTQEAILIATFGGDVLLNAALVLRLQGSKTGMQKLFESVLETSEAEVRQEIRFLARYQTDGSLASAPSAQYIIATVPTTPSQAQAMPSNAFVAQSLTAPAPNLPAGSRQANCSILSTFHSHLSIAEERQIETAVARDPGNDSFLSHKRERVKQLRDQIRKTRRSQAAYKWSTLKASMSAGILALTTAAFALTPYLWSATAYFVAIQSIWTCYFVLALVLPFAMPPTSDRNTFRASVRSTDSRAPAGHTPASSPSRQPKRRTCFSIRQHPAGDNHSSYSASATACQPRKRRSRSSFGQHPASTSPTDIGNSQSTSAPPPPANHGDAAQVELQSIAIESAPTSAPTNNTTLCDSALTTPQILEQPSAPSMDSEPEEQTPPRRPTPLRRPLTKLEC